MNSSKTTPPTKNCFFLDSNALVVSTESKRKFQILSLLSLGRILIKNSGMRTSDWEDSVCYLFCRVWGWYFLTAGKWNKWPPEVAPVLGVEVVLNKPWCGRIIDCRLPSLSKDYVHCLCSTGDRVPPTRTWSLEMPWGLFLNLSEL